MNSKTLSIMCLALLVPVQTSLASNAISSIHAEQWDLVREGDRLLKIKGLVAIIDEWSRKPGQIIEIRYPGGEEGEIWVHELIDWMVSLGVPSSSMTTVQGSGIEDVVHFSLGKTGD